MYVCMYVRMYVYMYKYMNVCVYIYIYIYHVGYQFLYIVWLWLCDLNSKITRLERYFKYIICTKLYTYKTRFQGSHKSLNSFLLYDSQKLTTVYIRCSHDNVVPWQLVPIATCAHDNRYTKFNSRQTRVLVTNCTHGNVFRLKRVLVATYPQGIPNVSPTYPQRIPNVALTWYLGGSGGGGGNFIKI